MTYENVVIGDAHVKPELPHVRIKATDSIVARGFDHAIGRFLDCKMAMVAGDVLLCGRTRRFLGKGIRFESESRGKRFHLREIVLARHFEMDESVGAEWHETPVVKQPLFIRAWVCYCENGFWYTVRRIFFGRQY